MATTKTVKMEDPEYVVANRYRKTLVDHFANIEKTGKRIKGLPASSAQHQKVQDNIQISIIQFLQANMFTLSLMPKVTGGSRNSQGADGGEVATMSFSQLQRLDAAAKALEAMRAQESVLRANLDDAVRRRRLEDASALRESLEEVEREIAALSIELEGLRATSTAARVV
ncbi:hypothetical protein HDU84_003323 [Entophlyctis sp. JEL0112]|nr:hypothetical protein HDU84_003323 [Entophlyctis sp. JEL0112]